MSKEESLLKTLVGMGFPVKKYPKSGGIAQGQGGFYLNTKLQVIEHWSEPAAWNKILADHGLNEHGMVLDGFQSVLPFEDIDHMLDTLSVWKDYIEKQGV